MIPYHVHQNCKHGISLGKSTYVDSQAVSEISFKVEQYYCKLTHQSKGLIDSQHLELQKTFDEVKKLLLKI